MKPTPIRLRAADLKPVLAGLGKAASPRGSSPALQCVKVETPGRDRVRLSATDGHLTLSVEVPAQTDRKGEPFLVPLGHLRDLAQGTRAGDELSLGPVASAPAISEFPEPPAFRATPIPLPDTAVTGLVHAFQCASNDTTRHVLQGAYLDTSGQGPQAHRIVGTDGRHLF
ncbi:MAG: hypothetical protein KDM63_18285, partial [Verrucomicrobiae bacterium]|nr:hypothetical protein [Verrucomicrobiae bacterium]